jgi:hypothetical protein
VDELLRAGVEVKVISQAVNISRRHVYNRQKSLEFN